MYWGTKKLNDHIFILPVSLLCKLSFETSYGNWKWRENNNGWHEFESSLSFMQNNFSQSFDLFCCQASNKFFAENWASCEALRLVFWFSVGKNKIYMSCYWNKMCIWNSGFLLWFFFFCLFITTMMVGTLHLYFFMFKMNWSNELYLKKSLMMI